LPRYASNVDVGTKINRLTIVSIISGSKLKPRRAVCLCDCGTIINSTLNSVRSGASRSCGCLKNEETIRRSTTHGMRRTPEYNSWAAMKARCLNPKASNYPWYGSKGVSVCKKWVDSFSEFYKDMGQKPGKSFTVDRIDPFGNYEPTNCQWATKKEQMNNLRSHHA
jgi:hypothetical protein